LAGPLAAARVLLAGETEGVYERYSPEAPGPVIPLIRTPDWEAVRGALGGSRGADVTGGMASKVRDMLKLAGAHPGLEVRLFSGLSAGTLTRALDGEAVGTAIRA
jgi:isopentenyl phosphate kinase